MFLPITEQGGIVGGVGQALAIGIPLTEEGKDKNLYIAKKYLLKIGEAEKDAVRISAIKEEMNQLKKPYAKDDVYWAIIITAFTIILLINGRFSLIEKFSILLVASFTVVTVVNLFALQSHEAQAVKSEEFIHGLSFNFPDSEFGKNPLLTAIATFGIIGVGAAELLAYPYWCMEKAMLSL